jgi:myo-inositol-1(or 4)-monophosphatase
MTGCSDELAVMLRAADGAAQLLRDQFARPERLRVDEKSASDFVSSADLRSQEIIRRALSGAYPAYAQLLEEGTSDGPAAPPGGPRFIVDPLDGTTNFLHGIPHFAVSIALEKDGEVAAGVVHDVAKGEIFACEKGQGAWLGTRRIRGSPERQLSRSVVGTGIPHHGKPHHRRYVTALAAIMPAVAGVRRMGSAALDLAYVAAGRFEAFFELGLAPWDVAAGTLLVREAGGIVTGVDGRPTGIDSGDILASSSTSLHRNMVDWLAPLHGVASRPVR